MRPPGGRSRLERGRRVELSIEKGVYRGRGLARLDGQVVLVARAHPGDAVLAEITEAHAGWAHGRLLDVLRPAPGRRAAPCPHFAQCGGCAYQDLDVAEQRRVKEAVLRESLGRAGAPWEGAIAVHPSPEQGWRLRASLHFAPGAEGPRLGLREEGSRRLVELDACLQLSERMNAASRGVREAVARRPSLWPALRGLDLLEAPDGSRLVASLETALRPREAAALGPVGTAAGLDGFGVGAGRRLAWLHGDPFVEAAVLGVRLRAHVRSFFQANRFLLEPLARTVVDLVPPGEGPILDLYAGVGLFALPLAARGERDVVAIEGAPTAVEDARWAAQANRLGGVQVAPGDVAEVLARLGVRAPERVVLDPPRTGAGAAVVEAVAARAPESIVYVSCDPPTLGRDLQLFAARGYRPDAVHLFDQFPDTFHLETVVRLRRA